MPITSAHRRRSIKRVKSAFLDCERTAEEALILASRCLVLALEERRNNKLPIETGADALIHMADAIAHAGKAFAALAKAHPHLRAIPAQLEIVDFGTSESENNQPFVNSDIPTSIFSTAA